MKKIAILLGLAMIAACTNAPQPIVQSNTTATKTEKTEAVTAHTTENEQPKIPAKSAEKTKWSQSGDPVDTTVYDGEVEKAQNALKAKPTNPVLIASMASAYFNRAEALTSARQYASALGDYRRALKYDPTRSDAKEWIEKIVMIYDGLNKEYPKEGEEPPALPFKKEK